jgi:hypothetical protein
MIQAKRQILLGYLFAALVLAAVFPNNTGVFFGEVSTGILAVQIPNPHTVNIPRKAIIFLGLWYAINQSTTVYVYQMDNLLHLELLLFHPGLRYRSCLHIHKFQNRLILLLRNCDHEITCCFGNC